MLAAWMWLGFTYLVLTLVFGIADFTQASLTGGITVIDHIMQYQIMTSVDLNFLFTTISVPMLNTEIFGDLWTMLIFNYNVFNGDLNLVRYFLLSTVGMGFAILLTLTFGPILLQVLATVRSLVPRIGPW